MPDNSNTPDRSSLLPSHIIWSHPGRSWGQGDVAAYEVEGHRFVVKDFRKRTWVVRATWGRWILRREYDRLERVEGIEGVPRPLGWIDRYAFAMEWLDAKRLPHGRDRDNLEPVFFDRLDKLVAEMHARGVTHGDLRRKNILVDDEQRPYLIDFATAWYVKDVDNPPRGFGRLCEVDHLTVLKLRNYYCPDTLTDEDRRRLVKQPLSLRAGRFLRKKVYRPFKPKHMRETWAKIMAFFSRRPRGD